MTMITFRQMHMLRRLVRAGSHVFTRGNFADYLRDPNQRMVRFPSEGAVAVEFNAKRKFKVKADVVQSLFKMENLRFISCLEKGEDSAPIKVVCGRAVILDANLGLLDAIFIRDHQDVLSGDMRNRDNYILCPGTQLADSAGNVFIPTLFWVGNGRLLLDLALVKDVFFPRGRLAYNG